MSQAFSSQDAAYSSQPAPSTLNQSGQVKRRARQRHVPVRVPMLDWPSHLFSDNASLGQLLMEDSPMQWHPATRQPEAEMYLPVAA